MGAPRGCYGVFVEANQQAFFRDRLEVRVFADRGEAGAVGAEIAAGIMRAEIERAGRAAGGGVERAAGFWREAGGGGGRAAVVFASAVSQDPFLGALRAAEIDWT